MIRLERTEAPEVLRSGQVAAAYREAEAFFAEDTRSARHSRFLFNDGILEAQGVYEPLLETSAGRCSFCTRPDQTAADLRVHRLRPPQDAVAADGRTSRRHYWWLAYEWENLYLACGDCRTAQGSKFPTEGRRVRGGTRERLAERERPYVLDPAGENPEPHFAYLDTGEVVWCDERGMMTVETFDLNRPLLVAERQGQLERTKAEIRMAAAMVAEKRLEEFVNLFLGLYAMEAPFAAMRRQFANQWVQVRPRKVEAILERVTGGEIRLAEVVGDLRRVTNRVKANLSRLVEPTRLEAAVGPALIEGLRAQGTSGARMELSVPRAATPREPPAYSEGREIHSVLIQNFQGVERMSLRVAAGAGEGKWLMLLGENGAGKTAALKAIALTLMEPKERVRVFREPGGVLRQGQNEGQVQVRLTGTRNVRTLRFSARERQLRSSGAPAPLLLAAYGATRLLAGEEERSEFKAEPHTGSLFDPRFPLSRPSEWIPDLDSEEFDAVARGLQTILRLDRGEEVRRHRGRGVEFDSPRGRFGLEELSEGYRTMAILALDMMRLFLRRWGNLDAAEGIVLIDEIGAHLHPRWQMQVVSTLRQTFPRVQFITTTHDPLCLRGLRPGEVVVIRRPGGRLVVEQDELPAVDALSVDQLLTSEHFGLYSALDPEVESEFERYYELMAAPELGEREALELAVLRDRLAGKRQLGQTRRERLALEAVDSVLAQESFAASSGELRALPEAARESVRELLAEVRRR